MTALTDDALRALMRTDPESGWRTFLEQYTPLMVGLIRRAGLDDRDEMMEVYVLICERLTANGFERLKSQDANRGSLGGWLAVIVRHAVVDWIRSRKGRRRVFRAIRDLDAFDLRVFEHSYWNDRSASEIAARERTDLSRVFEALDRIQSRLTDRHRAELLALAVRRQPVIALEESAAAERIPDSRLDPETTAHITDVSEKLEAALAKIPAEDAAIVRLKYLEGLSDASVEHALGIAPVGRTRIREILDRLRAALSGLGVGARDVSSERGLM